MADDTAPGLAHKQPPQQMQDRALDFTNRNVPVDSQAVLLSSTGSRAFGWAADSLDHDIHGAYSGSDWFDWVHYGREGLDLNLHNIEHLCVGVMWYRRGSVFVNVTNPFHIHSDFDFQGMVDLAAPEFYPPSALDYELWKARNGGGPRTALHAYRIALFPLHLFETGQVEHNIFQAARNLGLDLEGHLKCRACYRAQHGQAQGAVSFTDEDLQMALEEVAALRDRWAARAREGPEFDEGAWADWARAQLGRFGGRPGVVGNLL